MGFRCLCSSGGAYVIQVLIWFRCVWGSGAYWVQILMGFRRLFCSGSYGVYVRAFFYNIIIIIIICNLCTCRIF